MPTTPTRRRSTPGYRTALLISAGLLAGAGLVSFLLIRRPAAAGTADRVPVERCHHCGTSAPQAHPAVRSRDPAGAARRGRIDYSSRAVGQRAQAGQRVGAGRGQQLDAHVVRTGVEVGA